MPDSADNVFNFLFFCDIYL